jgi:hypothetical protein
MTFCSAMFWPLIGLSRNPTASTRRKIRNKNYHFNISEGDTRFISSPQHPESGLLSWHGGRSSNPGRSKIFLFSTMSRSALGPTQPHMQWPPRALSAGVERLGREADHSPPSIAEVRNDGAVPRLPHTTSWPSA